MKLHHQSLKNGGAQLCFWQNPSQVRTGSKLIAAEKLHLTPMVSSTQHIVTTTKSGSKPTCIELGKVSINDEEVWFLLPAPGLQLKQEPPAIFSEANNPTTRSAYWWVLPGEKSHWNMKEEVKNVLAGQFQVPVLTNPEEIKPFTRLVKPDASKKRKSYSSSHPKIAD